MRWFKRILSCHDHHDCIVSVTRRDGSVVEGYFYGNGFMYGGATPGPAVYLNEKMRPHSLYVLPVGIPESEIRRMRCVVHHNTPLSTLEMPFVSAEVDAESLKGLER